MKALRVVLAAAAVAAVLASCVSTGEATRAGSAAAAQPDRREYSGAAEAPGNTFLNARNKALMNAVQKAVADIIGAANEQANRATLDDVLYNTTNPNAFVFPETVANVNRATRGEDNWYYECSVQVNLVAVRNTLKANGLLGQGQSDAGSGTTVAAAPGAQGSPPPAPAAAPAPLAALSAEDRTFIARYVDRMTYMVYFAEEAGEEPFYSKSAVGKANEFLASLTYDTIDAEQVQRLKEDQRAAYEEETGRSISIIQWIAQRLNADIYVEIHGRSKGTSQEGKHYGEASIDLKAFEASTAVLMGSASYNTLEKSFSQTSQESARVNALQGAVYKTMPRLIEQVKANMAKAMERGLRYEVIIQSPLGDRAMSRFWSKLQDQTRGIQSVSQSAEEVKYYVWYIGSVDDLKNTIYDISETVAGIENMEMVLTRGKSMTFNTYR